MKRGFTLIEILVVIVIMAILVTIVLSVFPKFNKSQALDKDAETIVQILRQARSQTLSSKNATQYGVHFGSSAATLFSGSTYSSSASDNQVFTLQTSDLIVSTGLTGGGSDVIFIRLSGETSQYGTITVSSPTLSTTRTVTIYKTGVIQYK
jgi:prepilin-type N-terminal cleavage/methylation domain-containing protein